MTSSRVPTDKVYCSVAQPIYWSKNDTDKTIAQVKESNAAWSAICKKKQQPKAKKTMGLTFKQRWYEGATVATAFR